MLISMTGFGSGKYDDDGLHVRVEIRTVNHRFLEPVIRMPKGYLALEDRVRQMLHSALHRGRVEVYVEIEDSALRKRQVSLDTALLESYNNALSEAANIVPLDRTIDASSLVAWPGVIIVKDDDVDADVVWIGLSQAVGQALESLVQMRTEEGRRLYVDLTHHIDLFSRHVEAVGERAPHIVAAHENRLADKIKTWQTDKVADPDRVRAEIALMAERCDITEELTRLNSHIQGFQRACTEDEPIGRKLDFFAQEMLREVNTIGSKAGDVAVGEHVVAAKTTLERIREQVQNIE